MLQLHFFPIHFHHTDYPFIYHWYLKQKWQKKIQLCCIVLINILNNAKDALIYNQIENPWIKLSLESNETTVLITIEDNAGGVPEDIIPHIFEPYFTTKHQSQGTGLGLYMSYKIIVENLKGKLYAKNRLFGAKFFIELNKESYV